MKSNSILASILWIGLSLYSVSCYPADEEEYQADGDKPTPNLTAVMLTTPTTSVVSPGDTVVLRCDIKDKDPESALVWNMHNDNQHNQNAQNLTLLFADSVCFANQLCSHYQLDINSGALTIKNINDTIAGDYFCTFRTLSVLHKVYLKARVDSIVGPKTIDAGDNLRLTCRVSGYPRPQVMWHRQASDSSPKITLQTTPELTITNVNSAHAGIYTCTALSSDGTPSQPKTLNVTVVKGISAVDPIVNAGNSPANVELCCVYGQKNKNPLIKWLKNGKEVVDGQRYQINKPHKTRACLTITTVKEEDLGTYSCQFNKEADSKLPAMAEIELTGIPVTPELIDVSSDVTKTPILKWKVKSFSPVTAYQVRVKKPEQTEKDWLQQANKTVTPTNDDIIEQSLDSVPNGVYDVEFTVQNKFGSARLVSNNKVVVDRPNVEVIAAKINSPGNDGTGGASRSISISLLFVILGVVLSSLC